MIPILYPTTHIVHMHNAHSTSQDHVEFSIDILPIIDWLVVFVSEFSLTGSQ